MSIVCFFIYLSIALGLIYVFSLWGLYFAKNPVVLTLPSIVNDNESTLYYYLPETQIKIESSVKIKSQIITIPYKFFFKKISKLLIENQIIEQTFNISSESIADPGKMYLLKYTANCWMSDEVTYEVNDKGLLNNSQSVSTDDKTMSIVTKLFSFSKDDAAQKRGIAVEDIKEKITDIPAVKFSKNISEFINWETDVPWIVNFEVEGISENIDAGFKLIIKKPNNPGSIVNDITDKGYEGFITRPSVTVKLDIEPHLKDTPKPMTNSLSIIDTSQIFKVPIKRTPFVKRTDEVTFANGTLIKNKINNPSSFEGYITVPVKILKEVFSIPGQIFAYRTDLLEKQKKYEDKLLETEKFNLTRQMELDKQLLEIEKHNQTRQLQLEKALAEITNEIKELQKPPKEKPKPDGK